MWGRGAGTVCLDSGQQPLQQARETQLQGVGNGGGKAVGMETFSTEVQANVVLEALDRASVFRKRINLSLPALST